MGFSAIAAIVTIAGAATSADAQRKQGHAAADAGRAQERQAALEKRRADIQNARQLRSSLRQSRIAAAQIVNEGANTGTLGSSGVAGGLASVGAQTGANVGTTVQQGQLNEASYQEQVVIGGAHEQMGNAQAQQGYGELGMKVGSTLFGLA